MKIFVKLKPNSKHSSIKKTGQNKFSIKVKEPPTEGKANKALIELLSDKLNISKSRIKIISGLKARDKVLVIE